MQYGHYLLTYKTHCQCYIKNKTKQKQANKKDTLKPCLLLVSPGKMLFQCLYKAQNSNQVFEFLPINLV